MPSGWELPPVEAFPVQRVLLCDIYERQEQGMRNVSSSLPGHLLQLTTCGEAEHIVSGRRYVLRRHHLIWYHEDEMVRIHLLQAPWRFYTLNFQAPLLAPPPFEQRVRRVGLTVEKHFARVYAAWMDTQAPPAVRAFRVHSALAGLLGQLGNPEGERFSVDPGAQLWWSLESQLRQDLSQPVTLERMQALTGRSIATIARACKTAVDMTPMKRIKQVRMSLARGLLRTSDLQIKQIADRVGYGRVHEFSRDYRRWFNRTPTEERMKP